MVREASSLCSEFANNVSRVFLIEGMFTVLLSGIAFFSIVPLPEDSKFLTSDEKSLLLKRLEEDNIAPTDEDRTPLTLKQVLKVMTHWKVVLP